MKTKSKIAVMTGLVLSAAASSAVAQQLEEIVVTAQKREQNLQDVGIAMTALNGDDIVNLHYTNTSDIVAQSPGVLARRQFPSRGLRSNFFIRGVGSTDFNDATETPVAVYVDEFYMISPSTADFSLMDIERAEVLKGPQGTLFGRNANGGAVQFVTSKPDLSDTYGSIEAGIGSKDTRQIQGVLNAKVSDSFAIRVVGQVDDHGYYTKNVLPGGRDSGDQNYSAARVQLRFKPTDSFDAIYKFENGETRGAYGETSPLVTLAQPEGDVIRKPDNTNAYGYNPSEDGTNGPDRNAAEGFNSGYNKTQSHLLRLTWLVNDDMTLTSITGGLQQDYSVDEDCDGTPSIICNYNGFYDSEHYTQEFRLNGDTGRLNWTAGLYYLHQESSGGLNAPLYFTADGNPEADPATAGLGFYASFDNDLTAYAAFGQLEYELSDAVTLIGGLRYSRDKRHFEQVYPVYSILTPNNILPFRDPADFLLRSHTVTGLLLSNDFTDENAGGLTRTDESSWSGTAQANWTPAEGKLVYLSVRRGVKAAGFNNGSVPVFDITTELYPFKEEVLLAYEIGEKMSFLDDQLRINSAVFYYDYSDMQVVAFKTLGQVQTNADSTVKGGELEIVAVPVKGLELSAGVSFLDTNIENISRGAGLPSVDREMGEAPKNRANGTVRYEWDAGGGNMSAQVSALYVGERWTDAQNLTVGRLKSYTTVDAQVGFESADSKWSVLLWGRNLTDKRVIFNTLATLTGFNIGQAKWNEPRIGGVTVRYNF